MELFRAASLTGEALKVRVLAGIKVLVSAVDPEDLTQLQFGRRVRFIRSAVEARFDSLPDKEGCDCGFVLEGGSEVYLQDLAKDALLQALPV